MSLVASGSVFWILSAFYSGHILSPFAHSLGGPLAPGGLVAFVWVILGEGELGIQTFMFVVCPGVEELVVIIYRDS